MRTWADTSGGAIFLPRTSTQASPFCAWMILYGTSLIAFCTSASLNRRPISRLTAYKVFLGLVTAWRFAGAPTSTSLSSVYATIEGVVREPSEFSMTLGVPFSMIATHELVVPRSMPMIFAIYVFLAREITKFLNEG